MTENMNIALLSQGLLSRIVDHTKFRLLLSVSMFFVIVISILLKMYFSQILIRSQLLVKIL